jgi:hypothetical protein
MTDENRITKEKVLEKRRERPLRKCFMENSGVKKRMFNSRFSVKFQDTIQPIFEEMTGCRLEYSSQQYCCYLNTEEMAKVETWEKEQGSRVFLKDCLDLSIALGMNYESDNNTRQYTTLGQLEYDAKYQKDAGAIERLATISGETIVSLPFYCDAAYVCAVPS